MKNKILTATILSLFAVGAATSNAYAQLPGEIPEPDRAMVFSANEETAKMALDTAVSSLQNLTLAQPVVSYSSDGQVSITHMINTATGMKMISISALHDWTEANGYTYTDDTITAPNGTVVFPIESSEE